MGKITKWGRIWPVILLSCCVGGCATDPYLPADQSRRASIGTEWITYVRADATLTAEQKQLRELQYDEWGQEHVSRQARIVR